MSAAEKPLLVIAGPTASGKTALAMRVAEEFNGEIVSCDSVAVYRLMDIGSAKPSISEQKRVAHYCLDMYWPNEFCTAGDYARQARAAIAHVTARGKLPIVAGGTGLYLRALLHGLAPSPPRDEGIRERLRLSEKKRGPGHLHRLLTRLDGRASAAIHANDVPKLIRSLEVTLRTQVPQTEQWQQGRDRLQGYRVLQFALGPKREELYARINDRAAGMFANGLVEETDMLRGRFGQECRPLQSLGYAQAMRLLQNEVTLEEAVASAQQGHRNYAKRQLTWFRREKDLQWLAGCGEEQAVQEAVLRIGEEHIRKSDAIGAMQ